VSTRPTTVTTPTIDAAPGANIVELTRTAEAPTRIAAVDIERALRAAGGRIAPLWPLESFVAVNPYLGLADLRFSDAAELLASAARVPTSPVWRGRSPARIGCGCRPIGSRGGRRPTSTAARRCGGPPTRAGRCSPHGRKRRASIAPRRSWVSRGSERPCSRCPMTRWPPRRSLCASSRYPRGARALRPGAAAAGGRLGRVRGADRVGASHRRPAVGSGRRMSAASDDLPTAPPSPLAVRSRAERRACANACATRHP